MERASKRHSKHKWTGFQHQCLIAMMRKGMGWKQMENDPIHDAVKGRTNVMFKDQAYHIKKQMMLAGLTLPYNFQDIRLRDREVATLRKQGYKGDPEKHPVETEEEALAALEDFEDALEQDHDQEKGDGVSNLDEEDYDQKHRHENSAIHNHATVSKSQGDDATIRLGYADTIILPSHTATQYTGKRKTTLRTFAEDVEDVEDEEDEVLPPRKRQRDHEHFAAPHTPQSNRRAHQYNASISQKQPQNKKPRPLPASFTAAKNAGNRPFKSPSLITTAREVHMGNMHNGEKRFTSFSTFTPREKEDEKDYTPGNKQHLIHQLPASEYAASSFSSQNQSRLLASSPPSIASTPTPIQGDFSLSPFPLSSFGVDENPFFRHSTSENLEQETGNPSPTQPTPNKSSSLRIPQFIMQPPAGSAVVSTQMGRHQNALQQVPTPRYNLPRVTESLPARHDPHIQPRPYRKHQHRQGEDSLKHGEALPSDNTTPTPHSSKLNVAPHANKINTPGKNLSPLDNQDHHAQAQKKQPQDELRTPRPEFRGDNTAATHHDMHQHRSQPARLRTSETEIRHQTYSAPLEGSLINDSQQHENAIHPQAQMAGGKCDNAGQKETNRSILPENGTQNNSTSSKQQETPRTGNDNGKMNANPPPSHNQNTQPKSCTPTYGRGIQPRKQAPVPAPKLPQIQSSLSHHQNQNQQVTKQNLSRQQHQPVQPFSFNMPDYQSTPSKDSHVHRHDDMAASTRDPNPLTTAMHQEHHPDGEGNASNLKLKPAVTENRSEVHQPQTPSGIPTGSQFSNDSNFTQYIKNEPASDDDSDNPSTIPIKQPAHSQGDTLIPQPLGHRRGGRPKDPKHSHYRRQLPENIRHPRPHPNRRPNDPSYRHTQTPQPGRAGPRGMPACPDTAKTRQSVSSRTPAPAPHFSGKVSTMENGDVVIDLTED